MVDIEKLRELLASATKGPVIATERSGYHELLAPDEGCDWYGFPNHHAVAYIDTEIDDGEQTANSQLIAAVWNTLPALLDELERKTKALEAVEIARYTDDPEDWNRATKLTDAALKGTPNAH